MKKTIASILCLAMALGLALSGCSGSPSNPGGTPAASTTSTEGTSTTGLPGAGKKVALVCDPAGTQVFIHMMIDGLNNSAKKYGFEAIVVECADTAAYEDNIRALIEEKVDLIIGGGWLSADPLNRIAEEFPDAADYALIDSTVESKNVKCISYREQEGAYLIGMIAASVVDEGVTKFGAVHVNQGPGSWKWRYGFMEGVKSLIPEAEFNFYYTGNYNDPAKAKENAILLNTWGAQFINSAAAGGDIGVFEAALEKKFYTSGQDIDLTNPDNPYIVSSQIKDTQATMEYLLEKYFTDWTPGNEVWGLAEGTIGAVYVTQDGKNPMSSRISAEELAAVKAAAQDIKDGKINLVNIPKEEDYKF